MTDNKHDTTNPVTEKCSCVVCRARARAEEIAQATLDSYEGRHLPHDIELEKLKLAQRWLQFSMTLNYARATRAQSGLQGIVAQMLGGPNGGEPPQSMN